MRYAEPVRHQMSDFSKGGIVMTSRYDAVNHRDEGILVPILIYLSILMSFIAVAGMAANGTIP